MQTASPSAESLAEELLGRKFEDLGAEEQRVLERVASGEIEDCDADEVAAVHMTFGQRLADRVAAVGGSWGFIILFSLVLFAWMFVNSPLAHGLVPEWDEYPYVFLNLMLSTLAALQAPVIMMSQNRQSQKDRLTAHHDYEVNLRTQLEIVRLHRKMDKLFNKLGQLEGKVGETTEAVREQVAA
ncbi:DUF1003 domain-containing protein [Novosphingobium olei]|uniref:DUF1003 domain-containing protein n=1 Tax=Novosphingobium olei TaxID=2728851 RepID=A0A7Y0BLY1_9SPHN|nr:DUF1003 domain-containing protein [Novosphingobium olei]NML92759.1 DUF1003 domain-containing protein [Novosphingobium olei]BEV01383.1 DUF1003 domain-containing protein [Novosphingobium olei]